MNEAFSNPDVRRLFDRACELEGAARADFLDAEAEDPALRKQVEELLAHFDKALGSEEVALRLPQSGSTDELPVWIGSYRVLRRLGQGGMGIVYLAEQRNPQREVAVKVMQAGLRSDRIARRFELEAELLGRLQDPGIAQIYESGIEGEGTEARAYLVMEYVDGQPLNRFVEAEGLELIERVRLIAELAHIVHRAHRRGVLHRDLKPSNILVTPAGQVKIIDFGVARALDRDFDGTQHTRTGEIVGTLAYMSPEQVRGDVASIDARSDVYALGTLAYEVFAGRLPLELRGLTLTAAAERLCNADPPALGKLDPRLSGDLEWIVAKALEKEPSRRYESAHSLATDLERHLADESVEARPASAIYVLRKLARRHRIALAGLVATFVAIVAGAVVSLSYAVKSQRLAELESRARADADEHAARAQDEARRAKENEAEAARLRGLAEQRLDDLQFVSHLQRDQLTGVDIRSLGAAIAEELRSEVRHSLERRGAEPEVVEERLEALEATLDEANLTSLATRTLQRGLLDRMGEAIRRDAADRPVLQAELLMSHAVLLLNVGAPLAALEASEAALELFESGIDADRNQALVALSRYAGMLYEAGYLQEALDHLERVGPMIDEALGAGSREALYALQIRAAAAGTLGRVSEAADLFGEELRRLAEFGSGSPEETRDRIRVAEANQITSLIQAGRGEEAGERLLELVELAENDEQRSSHLFSLAQLQIDTGELDAAADSLEEADAATRRYYGDDSLKNALYYQLRSRVHAVRGELAEAANAAAEAYEIHRRELGDRHDRTLRVAYTWVQALLAAGALEEADGRCDEALSIAIAEFGAESVQAKHLRSTLLAILRARAEEEGSSDYEERIRELGG